VISSEFWAFCPKSKNSSYRQERIKEIPDLRFFSGSFKGGEKKRTQREVLTGTSEGSFLNKKKFKKIKKEWARWKKR